MLTKKKILHFYSRIKNDKFQMPKYKHTKREWEQILLIIKKLEQYFKRQQLTSCYCLHTTTANIPTTQRFFLQSNNYQDKTHTFNMMLDVQSDDCTWHSKFESYCQHVRIQNLQLRRNNTLKGTVADKPYCYK